MNAVNTLAQTYDMPILYSCHPRSQKYIEQRNFVFDPHVIRHQPLGFFDYNKLQQNAFCVVSDSGSITSEQVLQAVELVVTMHKNGDNGAPVPAYTDENVSTKVVKIIQSYTGIINKMVWRKN